MRCCICKIRIGKNETKYYTHYQTNGHWRRKTWCKFCDKNRPELVEKMLERLERLENKNVSGAR